MKISRNPEALREAIQSFKIDQKTIGFVPTMGALHAGHFSLIQSALRDNDVCISSIFVNPTQFNNPNDLANYPNTLEKDLESLEQLGCDLVFVPDAHEIYPEKPVVFFNFGALETVMEGAHRPGHFNGVALIVSKLFHLVEPNRAYFGQKDLQQFAVISQLVTDLSFQISLVCCPTLREKDGLAMSSRNLLLSEEHRPVAPLVHQTLQRTKKALLEGESPEKAIALGSAEIKSHPAFKPEYLEVVDFKTLMPLTTYSSSRKTAICIATFLGNVRLIDNIVF